MVVATCRIPLYYAIHFCAHLSALVLLDNGLVYQKMPKSLLMVSQYESVILLWVLASNLCTVFVMVLGILKKKKEESLLPTMLVGWYVGLTQKENGHLNILRVKQLKLCCIWVTCKNK